MHQQAGRARRHVSVAAISVAIIALGVTPAYAQRADAEALFNEAEKLMGEGKFAQACDAFEASNKIEPSAGTLISLGQCREQNQQLASAWSAYKDALLRVKDPVKRDFALTRSAELEPKLSILTILILDQNRVAGLTITRNDKPIDPVPWNRPVPIDGGQYVFVVRAVGHEEWRTTVTVPVDSGKTNVDVPKLKEVVKPPPKPVEERGGHPSGTFTTKRKMAVGLVSVGVASLVTGIVVGRLAKNKEKDAFALCDSQTLCANAADAESANDLVRSGHRLSIGAGVMFGVAGIAAIGAGVLWFTGAPESPHRVAIVPIANGISVRGRF